MDVVTLKKAVKDAGKYFADSRIVEQGSNENGEYVRWENGLQVCWSRGTVDLTVDSFQDIVSSYPAAFATHPAVSFGGGGSSLGIPDVEALRGAFVNGIITRWRFSCPGTGTASAVTVAALAVGRWK